MRWLTFISMLFFSGFANVAFACDCMDQGPFLQVAPQSRLVALVKVERYLTFKTIDGTPTPMSMEVEVVAVYKGKEKRKRLTVWGDNGALCRPYLSQFATGKYYVIAFYTASDGAMGQTQKEEKTTDYAISSCGAYWLQVDSFKQVALGKVTKKQAKIKLSDLKAKLSSK